MLQASTGHILHELADIYYRRQDVFPPSFLGVQDQKLILGDYMSGASWILRIYHAHVES